MAADDRLDAAAFLNLSAHDARAAETARQAAERLRKPKAG